MQHESPNAANTSNLITELTPQFLREFEAEVRGTIPQEKVQADLRQAEIGRMLVNEGSVVGPGGLGQKLGEVDGRIYHRWAAQEKGCWQDKAFVDAFFQDNPAARSPGWKPKTDKTRHGITFSQGQSISNMNSLRNGS